MADKGEIETYLGDGVYASFDGWHIWLRVERDGRNERVALEPRVYFALEGYAKMVYPNPNLEGSSQEKDHE